MSNTEITGLPQSEEVLIRELVRDLHQPGVSIFWIDLFATAILGWSAFGIAIRLGSFSPATGIAVLVAILALYRGLCFLHEISHLTTRNLPGFERAWNILFGLPLLMPSFIYVGVHQYHHKLSTYGTKQDPEYLPFASSALMSITFAVQSFLVPVFLIVRFLLLTPVGFMSARFERWLVIHASSLTMNVAYRRELSDVLLRKVRMESASVWVLWAVCAVATVGGLLPWRFWAIWLCVTAVASFINTLRTLGAHAYESAGQAMSREQQLQDSIDTPGAIWTELWAPVGLRYHALHHYFPGIPYHNLPEAYRRLTHHLESAAAYHEARSPSLPHSLRRLIVKGMIRGS